MNDLVDLIKIVDLTTDIDKDKTNNWHKLEFGLMLLNFFRDNIILTSQLQIWATLNAALKL